jgi:hypothetical protein
MMDFAVLPPGYEFKWTRLLNIRDETQQNLHHDFDQGGGLQDKRQVLCWVGWSASMQAQALGSFFLHGLTNRNLCCRGDSGIALIFIGEYQDPLDKS